MIDKGSGEMSDKRNHHGVKKPTEDMAIQGLAKADERTRKALTVARLAIDLYLEELERR